MPTDNKNLFKPASKDDQAFLLASHMPRGRLRAAVFDDQKNLGKLAKGLSVEFYNLAVLIADIINNELDINQTESLLEDWEESVGIPDDCFSTNTSLTKRRLQVLQKFSNFGGVQKAEDFVRVAAVFGFNITVTPASRDGLFPLVFPIPFYADVREATHTILVEFVDLPEEEFFPLDFPLPFSSGGQAFLQCIFERLAPANVQVLFI